jgi:hypothetical protein
MESGLGFCVPSAEENCIKVRVDEDSVIVINAKGRYSL